MSVIFDKLNEHRIILLSLIIVVGILLTVMTFYSPFVSDNYDRDYKEIAEKIKICDKKYDVVPGMKDREASENYVLWRDCILNAQT